MPSLNRKTSLAWKGIAQSPEAANSFRVANLNHDIHKVNVISDDNYVGAFQSDKNRIGGRYAEVNFTSELRGYTPETPTDIECPEWALLKACGFSFEEGSPDGTYILKLDDLHFSDESPGVVTAIDLSKNTDGKLWSAIDCVGDVTFNFIANQIPTMDFAFKGNYSAAVSAASMIPYVVGAVPVACQAGSVVIANGSTYNTLVVRSLTYSVGNIIPDRPDLNSSFGYAPFAITGREPIATMVIELPYTLSDFNPEELYDAQEQLTITYSHNASGSAGSQIDLEFDGYINELPIPSDDNGIMVYTLSIKQSVDAGLTPELTATPFTLTWS